MTTKNAGRLLTDGTVAQGIVNLAASGEIADPAPSLHLDLISNQNNYYPNITRGFIFGKRDLINDTTVDLWGGPTDRYVFPTAPQQMVIKSTSIADAVGGTGASSIHLEYLDDNYLPHTLNMNVTGISAALTIPTNILRINAFHVTAVGSTGAAVGDISVTNLAGTVTYGFIDAGSNTAEQGFYTVPAGYAGYIKHWQNSSGSAGSHFCETELLATSHDGILHRGVFLLQDENGTQNGGNSITLPIPIPIPPTADVKLSAISDGNAANVSALGAIMGWFEKIQQP